MPVIRIDNEVWKCLQQKARPFVDNPNDVLRSILGLGEALSSSRVQDEPTESDKEVDSVKKRVTRPAAGWFRRELSNPNSSISTFLIGRNIYQRDFNFFKRYVASSKYFQAGESYPGICVWWLQIPLSQISEPDGPFPFKLMLCQKQPSNFSDFWCLATPLEYLNSEYIKGNLDTLGNKICLHLSVENCTYRGYGVKMFDDVRLTMRTGQRPIPFGQFRI